MPIRTKLKLYLQIAAATVVVDICKVLLTATPVLVFALIFWVAALGGWEPPTLENIQKLDAELGATD